MMNRNDLVFMKYMAVNWEVAACKGKPASMFFPPSREIPDEVKELCAGCAIRSECLDYALFAGEQGIWGGRFLSSSEKAAARNNLTSLTTKSQVPKDRPSQTKYPAVIREGICGTYAGYMKHFRSDELSCEACNQAAKEYRQQRAMGVPQ